MTIGVWDYLPEYHAEKEDILEAVTKVFDSGRLILGPSVSSFEEEFARYNGVQHCIGVDNGTNALVLGLRALGVGPGDEVITVANTAAPTIVAIDQIGAIPVFVDVTRDDHLMDVNQIAEHITARTSCILPVHLYGQCVPMAPILEMAKEHGLRVLEDCAQSHGALHHGQIAGSMGDAAAFSFYPTKVLGAYGDGGAVITNQAAIDENVRRLRYYGMESRYYVEQTPGHNSRLDEVQAEILRRKLRRIGSYIEGRQAVANGYAEGLSGTSLELPVVAEGNTHVYYVYVVRHPARDEIMAKLAEQGINLNISYPWPVHTMRGFTKLGYQEGSLPVTEELAQRVFALSVYPSLSQDNQSQVIETLRSILDTL